MDIEQVLIKKFVGKRWSITEGNYETLQWDDESPKPTLVELEALIPIIETEAATAQAERRAAQAVKVALKASAKEKLIAGLPLTAEEAETLIA
jgi:hypothetical protein